jgi:D-alanine-D-alanine ligase
MNGRDHANGVAPLDITVLMGGPSREREVSLLSGAAIADGLERRGHKVTRADITPKDTAALDRAGTDVVFIALHGEFGESGEVQRLCEQRSLAYTGSGSGASQLAMDKASAKQCFRKAGLTTPDWMIIEEWHSPGDVQRWLGEIEPPLVVKPVDGGSSIDVTICSTQGERDAALDDLLDRYRRAMIERFVAGREITVGILGEHPLPVLEVVPAREFYDYTAKYAEDGGTRYAFDHGLCEDAVTDVQTAALKAHRALGCRDMSRVDFMLGEDGRSHVLEVNTIPGFTSHSLLPMAAAEAGIGFDELVDRLALMAFARSGASCLKSGT